MAEELLLEIGCEEIPSRYMGEILEQFREDAAALLEESRLPYTGLETWGTPRRLVLLVNGLKERQADKREKIKGPPRNRAFDAAGRPTPALLGFARGHGASPEDLAVEEIKGAEYMFLYRELAGKPAREVLTGLLPGLVGRLNFPKSMYWHNREVRFARPVRWILALYGREPVCFEYAGITAGRETRGHRFFSPGSFPVASPAEYFRRLEESAVVLNQARRRDLIRRQVQEAASALGGRAIIGEDLLEEVTYLVENPAAVTGSFAREYLELPREVLITTMQHHQRYFPVASGGGEFLLPYFIGISNNGAHDNIRRGYEKVLAARLADARFFYDEDRKKPLHGYLEQLSRVTYQESLGSLAAKSQRVEALTRALGSRLGLSRPLMEGALRAARLSKADLVTLMVKEFPELQGIMGREYALAGGEAPEVARAIFEHYLPRHAGDILPATLEGALVSLADRLDTLAGCFAVGIQPTGSQDPYALRRQALGAAAILTAHGLEISLETLFEEALLGLREWVPLEQGRRGELVGSLREFFLQRLRFLFQEKGLSHDVCEAVLGAPFGSVAEAYGRAGALEKHTQGPVLAAAITAYTRVANLARAAGGEEPDPALFQDDAERKLYRALQEARALLEAELAGKRYASCLNVLQTLKEPVDRFFDAVLVMAEDEKVRKNRLNLLAAVKALFRRIADFSLLSPPA